MKNCQLMATVISVENIEHSKQFYMELFDEEVKFDFGKNIAFKSGLSLQQDFDWLVNIPKESQVYQSHTVELCYEITEFDTFIEELKKQKYIEYLHDVIKYNWKQRVIRIYDPDRHIIEISEAMSSVFSNYLDRGFSIDEVAEITQHPVDFILSTRS